MAKEITPEEKLLAGLAAFCKENGYEIVIPDDKDEEEIDFVNLNFKKRSMYVGSLDIDSNLTIEYEVIDMDGKYIKHTAKAKSLLLRLGIKSYSVRHLKMIEDFLKEGDKDLRGLLTGLGDWDENDLLVAEAWFKEM